MTEPVYKVVWPLGKSASEPVTLKTRPNTLNDITIGEVSNFSFRAETIFPIIRESLHQRFPNIKFIEYPVFGNTHGTQESEVINNLPEKLHQHGCDVIISGVGG
jgi:hypothetical protein